MTCNFILVVRWECGKSVESRGNSQREGPEVGGTARRCIGLKQSQQRGNEGGQGPRALFQGEEADGQSCDGSRSF